MKQRVNIVVNGATCSTTLTDAETAKLLDALRHAWGSGTNAMITVTDTSAGCMPMHIQAAAVQVVHFGQDST